MGLRCCWPPSGIRFQPSPCNRRADPTCSPSPLPPFGLHCPPATEALPRTCKLLGQDATSVSECNCPRLSIRGTWVWPRRWLGGVTFLLSLAAEHSFHTLNRMKAKQHWPCALAFSSAAWMSLRTKFPPTCQSKPPSIRHRILCKRRRLCQTGSTPHRNDRGGLHRCPPSGYG